MKNNRKIDLRPHYTFAYSSESMEFRCRDLVYYSKKDKALHFVYVAGEYGYIVREGEDKEFQIPIADEDAKILEKVFGLCIDAYLEYISNGGSLWWVCDGSDCTVICGKRRAHFEGPCGQEPFGAFSNMANRLLSLKENSGQEKIEEIIKSASEVEKLLEEYIGNKL